MTLSSFDVRMINGYIPLSRPIRFVIKFLTIRYILNKQGLRVTYPRTGCRSLFHLNFNSQQIICRRRLSSTRTVTLILDIQRIKVFNCQIKLILLNPFSVISSLYVHTVLHIPSFTSMSWYYDTGNKTSSPLEDSKKLIVTNLSLVKNPTHYLISPCLTPVIWSDLNDVPFNTLFDSYDLFDHSSLFILSVLCPLM